MKELNPNDVGFYIATPYPGTPLYEEVKASGRLKVTDFDKYDTATPTFEIPNFTMAGAHADPGTSIPKLLP